LKTPWFERAPIISEPTSPAKPAAIESGRPARRARGGHDGILTTATRADAELIELVCAIGSRAMAGNRGGRRSTWAPAHLAGWSAARWASEMGVAPAFGAAMAAAFELGRRALEGRARRSPIRGPEDVEPHVRDLLRARKEHFVVLLLNARHEMEARETVSIGSLNASIVHPREVFLPAILHSAASVVLVHNHPSGDPEPSEEDLSITRRLVQVGDLVGIGVLDHVIVAERGVVSLRSRQLL